MLWKNMLGHPSPYSSLRTNCMSSIWVSLLHRCTKTWRSKHAPSAMKWHWIVWLPSLLDGTWFYKHSMTPIQWAAGCASELNDWYCKRYYTLACVTRGHISCTNARACAIRCSTWTEDRKLHWISTLLSHKTSHNINLRQIRTKTTA